MRLARTQIDGSTRQARTEAVLSLRALFYLSSSLPLTSNDRLAWRRERMPAAALNAHDLAAAVASGSRGTTLSKPVCLYTPAEQRPT